MFAYAPDGTQIVASKETIPGRCTIAEEGFKLDADGNLDLEYNHGTDVDWDNQRTTIENGEPMLIDANDAEWPLSSLIILDHELEEDESLPAPALAAADLAHTAWAKSPDNRKYVIERPADGWRQVSSFTDNEKARLRPVAETLAMLDGNAFFGMNVIDGDDVHYEQYLPEAAAIAEANNGWFALTSFVRGGKPLPDNPMGLSDIEDTAGRVDLAAGLLVSVQLSGIQWDVSDQDDVSEQRPNLRPLLPTDLIIGVPADWQCMDIPDLISNHYGFLVMNIGSIEPIVCGI